MDTLIYMVGVSFGISISIITCSICYIRAMDQEYQDIIPSNHEEYEDEYNINKIKSNESNNYMELVIDK